MHTETPQPAADHETLSAPVVIDIATGPSPDQTDQIIARYESAVRLRKAADETEEEAKKALITLVKLWGHAAAGSEHSSVIDGALNTAMVTDVTKTSLNEEKIAELFELLADNQRKELFSRLFGTRVKHELVAGGDDSLRTADMPQWLRKNAKALFGECIKVSNLAPRVKVDMRVKEQKTRKPRAKKAVAA